MKPNIVTVILVIVSLGIGYYLNTLANERNNKKLIAAFKAELELLNLTKLGASSSGRIAIEQQQEIIQAQINLLESL